MSNTLLHRSLLRLESLRKSHQIHDHHFQQSTHSFVRRIQWQNGRVWAGQTFMGTYCSRPRYLVSGNLWIEKNRGVQCRRKSTVGFQYQSWSLGSQHQGYRSRLSSSIIQRIRLDGIPFHDWHQLVQDSFYDSTIVGRLSQLVGHHVETCCTTLCACSYMSPEGVRRASSINN